MGENGLKQHSLHWLGLPLRNVIVVTIGIFVLGLVSGMILFGDTSLQVLNGLHRERDQLTQEKRRLQRENQRLQKRYFELMQIIGN